MKTQYIIPTDPAVLAYAAGLFDGEGCVQISKPYNKKSDKRYHRLDVSISQKDLRPLVWMKEHFGGRIQLNSRKVGKIYFWLINDKAAGGFLASVRPYLVLKGEQADIAIAFRATVSEKGLGNVRMFGGWGKTAFQHPSPIDTDLEAKRDILRNELSRLKVVK